MVRAQEAETGDVPPYDEPRLLWLHIFYDWESRRKRVFENGALNRDNFPRDLGPNEHYYKVQLELPPPDAERREMVLPVPVCADSLVEMRQTRKSTGDVAYDIARFIFFRVGEALPAAASSADILSRGNGIAFGGKSPDGKWDHMKPEVHVNCQDGLYRIVVEKIG